jgi:hypothetical protein
MYCLKIQCSDKINGINLEKIKRYDKSNRLNFEKFIATINGMDLVLKSYRYNKSNGLNFKKVNVTIKSTDLILKNSMLIIRHNFTKCYESDTFNEKNYCFKNNMKFSSL